MVTLAAALIERNKHQQKQLQLCSSVANALAG
jgi:hypothetical protein